MSVLTPTYELDKTPIGALLTDIDGVHVPNGYDTTGEASSGPTKEVDDFFDWIRGYNSRSRVVPVILTSGRSFAQIKGIAYRSGNKNPIISEHGMVIRDQESGFRTTVFEKVPKFESYKDVVLKLADLRNHLYDSLPKMKRDLQEMGYKTDRIVMAPGKEVSIAVNIAYDGEYEGAIRVPRDVFFSVVWKYVPPDFRKKMYTPNQEFEKLVGEKSGKPISIFADNAAVNLKPPVNKQDALEYILSEDSLISKKFKLSKKEEVGLIDDRDSESMSAMRGPIFAPADCSDQVKKIILERFERDRRGALVYGENIHGLKDVLNIVNRWSGYMM